MPRVIDNDMPLMALLIALRAGGARIDVDGGFVDVDAPPGILTPEICSAIAKHKKALMNLPRPYLTPEGELRSPSQAPPQYHWQSMTITLRELKAPPEVWRKYTNRPYEE